MEEKNGFEFQENAPGIDLEAIQRKVGQWIGDFKSGLPEPWGATLDDAIGWVRKNPKTAAAIGVAAGFTVGFIGARRISHGFRIAAKNPKATSFAMQAVSGFVAAAALKGAKPDAPAADVAAPAEPPASYDVPDPQITVELGEATGAGLAPGVVTSAGVPGEDRPMSPSEAQAGSRA